MLNRLLHFGRVMLFSAASIAGVFAGTWFFQYLYNNYHLNLTPLCLDITFFLFGGTGAVIFFGILWVVIGFGNDPD